MWRCDSLESPMSVLPVTTWHPTEDAALAEAHRLRFAGRTHVVAWYDAQGAVA